MSRAEFRLSTLLRVRKLQEDSAATTLAGAAARRLSAEHHLGSRTAAMVASGFPATADPTQWRATVAARAALMTLVEDARAAVNQELGEEDAAREAWRDARRRVVPIERLAERHEAEQLAEELSREQLVIDEVAQRGAPERDLP